jgi:hypothetical protein
MAESLELEIVYSAKSRGGRDFIEFPHLLYRGCDRWVPQFRRDIRYILDRRNPFLEEARAEFFLARRGGAAVGTIAAIDNVPYNRHHGSRLGHFHFFDCTDDPEASHALFAAAFGWLRGRGLTAVRGPYGFGLMGMGVLVEGFEHRAAMTMMSYNYPYYSALVEAEGFIKQRDQFSSFLDADAFRLPEKIRRVAEIALARGNFTVPEFKSKRSLKAYAQAIGKVYNESFQSHGDEFSPMSERQVAQLADELVTVADPSLIKLLLYKGEIAGFLFGFPDLSAALQRAGGRLTPLSLPDILREYRSTKWLIVNGADILPQYQRLGGNALLYYALERIAAPRRFKYVEAVQVAESTDLMLADLKTLGAKIYKTHRTYERAL